MSRLFEALKLLWLITVFVFLIITVYKAMAFFSKLEVKKDSHFIKKEEFVKCDNKAVLQSVNRLLKQYYCDMNGCDSTAKLGTKIVFVNDKQLVSDARFCIGKAVVVDKAGVAYAGAVGYFDYEIKKVKVIKNNNPNNGYAVNLYPQVGWQLISAKKSKEIYQILEKDNQVQSGDDFAY